MKTKKNLKHLHHRNNLITLCENKETKCHLKIGHLGSWRKINPDVAQSASEFKENLSKPIEP